MKVVFPYFRTPAPVPVGEVLCSGFFRIEPRPLDGLTAATTWTHVFFVHCGVRVCLFPRVRMLAQTLFGFMWGFTMWQATPYLALLGWRYLQSPPKLFPFRDGLNMNGNPLYPRCASKEHLDRFGHLSLAGGLTYLFGGRGRGSSCNQ